ncbi:MAG: carbohydrate kinase family protein [Firmicutes bacterium]|nr:carbohydrate kinase family protein [Bacillota bacterium]
MSKKKVLCIAECCCDLIFAGMPGIPRLGEEIYGRDFVIKPGGGANTPISLSLLGTPVSLLTALGDDDMGCQIGETLKKSGVQLWGQQHRPGRRTAVSAVMSTDTDRCFASYGGTGGLDWDILETAIAQADIVQTYLGYCRQQPIVRLCGKYGKMLCVDANYADVQDRKGALAVLTGIDYLKVNEQEAACLSGCEDVEAALAFLGARTKCGVIVTRGSRGGIAMDHGKPYTFSAVNMGEFRDACGAGDNFAAGFLYGLSQGKAFPRALEYGSRLAGLAVTWYGGNDQTLNCTKLNAMF